MDINFKKMQIQDLEEIDISDFDDFWNINILKNDLIQDFSIYIVARLNDEIVGFAGINLILDEAHIANIAVRKDKRRMKIGSQLLENLISIAREKVLQITLEVNETNLPAINLYKKYGFEILGKRKKYYNNQFDAYIMTKYLSNI